MPRVNITEAKAHSSDLVKKAMCGEDVIIFKNDKPLVKLVPVDRSKGPRKPGSGKGQIHHVAPDLDATPQGFKD